MTDRQEINLDTGKEVFKLNVDLHRHFEKLMLGDSEMGEVWRREQLGIFGEAGSTPESPKGTLQVGAQGRLPIVIWIHNR